ncbi:MAG TPA: low affinity iron permease family protein [Phenylobacterium sp.]
MSIDKAFAGFANRTSQAAGSPWTFCACLVLVLGWAASGPLFGFSETWQLVINTGTTIITFLMVFLIQNTQNRDNAAIQAKLDNLILTSDAENEFIGIEKMTDKELAALQARCEAKARTHQDAHGRVLKEVQRRGGKDKVEGRDKRPSPRRKPAGRKAA